MLQQQLRPVIVGAELAETCVRYSVIASAWYSFRRRYLGSTSWILRSARKFGSQTSQCWPAANAMFDCHTASNPFRCSRARRMFDRIGSTTWSAGRVWPPWSSA
jgi:hypothetical protein